MRKLTRLLIPFVMIFTFISVTNGEIPTPTYSVKIASAWKSIKIYPDSSDITLSLKKTFIAPASSFTYFSQADPMWKDYKYGGRDSMAKYGCGPTVLSMLVTNLTEDTMSPVDAADWSAQNGYWSPGGGSAHTLIPEGAQAFGLKAESLSVLSPDALLMPLQYDKLIVLLMGPGHFTQKGHFIILTDVTNDGRIIVADPYNPDNNKISWAPELILNELSTYATAGGPAWVISKSI